LSFVAQPVSVSLVVAFHQPADFHLAQIVAELIEPHNDLGTTEGSEDGLVDVLGE
jgi:hypothetical protein